MKKIISIMKNGTCHIKYQYHSSHNTEQYDYYESTQSTNSPNNRHGNGISSIIKNIQKSFSDNMLLPENSESTSHSSQSEINAGIDLKSENNPSSDFNSIEPAMSQLQLQASDLYYNTTANENCIKQLRNILEQMILIYSGKEVTIETNNENVCGTLLGIQPALNRIGGFLELGNSLGVIESRINLGNITGIRLKEEDSYFANGQLLINLITVPISLPDDTNSDFECAVRELLSPMIGTRKKVEILSGGMHKGPLSVDAIGYGVVFLDKNQLILTKSIEKIQ